jgi:hypothetical protein
MTDIKKDPVGFVMNWADRQKEQAGSMKELKHAAQGVYETRNGRIVFDAILEMMVTPSAEPDPYITYYNEGQRAVAIWLNNLLKPEAQEPEQQLAEINQPEE